MSQAELAALLSINPKSLHALEASEAKKTIRLDSLEKVAAALDCDLVYALVPRDSLENHYCERARQIIEEQVAGVENSMALENQALNIKLENIDKFVNQLIAEDRVNWRQF
jgi:predicted DNA-binding mobile mystery protein A